MAGVELSRKALEQLQDSVHDRSVDLVKVKDGKAVAGGGGFPAKAPASTVFGALDDSAGLASAVETVEATVGSELDAAKNRLKGVENALDLVRRNIKTADDASTAPDSA
ncbi:hypothetical protein [Nonomuraea cavernae]|uniref:Uncharacterized protein n=1 Tax=Nonomuraea cavernae TaxID=2045107 RepID=A0A917ZI76_9ACTN|nr:hypothetical protein [Nonomuraea cavernae]MCA2190067.1 hypothetical protein [Nonomuraea cavernae]GGO82987.1 hypothetical protein GCM10012289_75500 [Nonomuraea cavernae]